MSTASQKQAVKVLKALGYTWDGNIYSGFWVAPVALTEKPKPRTKVVYEKVESLLSCIDDHIEEKLYNKVGDEFRKCTDCQKAVASTFLAGCLYRKVDKEIDWNDELASFFDGLDYGVVERHAYYRGEIGLDIEINEKDFISMCHLVASLTDKPE